MEGLRAVLEDMSLAGGGGGASSPLALPLAPASSSTALAPSSSLLSSPEAPSPAPPALVSSSSATAAASVTVPPSFMAMSKRKNRPFRSHQEARSFRQKPISSYNSLNPDPLAMTQSFVHACITKAASGASSGGGKGGKGGGGGGSLARALADEPEEKRERILRWQAKMEVRQADETEKQAVEIAADLNLTFLFLPGERWRQERGGNN